MTTSAEQAWTTRRLLAWIAEAFTKKGLEAPRLQSEMLVAHILGCDRLRLYMEADRPASPLELQTLRGLVARALKDEPIDYLVGERWFFGLPFHVSSAVLVPRPCTEAIVEQVLLQVRARGAAGGGGAAAKSGEGIRIADVCTGSGCIAISILKNLPAATAIATDISIDALAIAKRNAERHKVADRLELIEGDLLAPLFAHPSVPGAPSAEGFHYLVSNPPYIPDHEWADVPPNVRNYEPETALRAGADGLQFINPILADGPQLLRNGGLMLIETAASTAHTVLEIAKAHPLLAPDSCRIIKDLDALPRIVVAERTA